MNFRSGSGTGVSSRRYDSFRYDIFWWYHVNEYRATRGNRSELDPQRKSLESDIMQTAPNFVLSCGFAIAISVTLQHVRSREMDRGLQVHCEIRVFEDGYEQHEANRIFDYRQSVPE